MKTGHPKHGQLAPRDVILIPWTEVHVDLIGPWKYKVRGLREIAVRALTMIDPVTNLVEIVRVHSTRSEENKRAFENTWLSRYPLPEVVVSDNGPEFVGHEWAFGMTDWGIKAKRTTPHTPTANSVIEASHRAMGQLLRTILPGEQADSMEALNKSVDHALAMTMRAMRCASNTSLQGFAPASVVFGRDMNFNVPFVVDLLSIAHNKQLQTDARLLRENRRRSRHEYSVGQSVLVNNHHSSSDKLKPAFVGPFRILRVHTNGTVTIERGQVHERMSIRRIKPVSV